MADQKPTKAPQALNMLGVLQTHRRGEILKEADAAQAAEETGLPYILGRVTG